MTYLVMSQPNLEEAMQDRNCSLEKIVEGYYLGALTKLAVLYGGNLAEDEKVDKRHEQWKRSGIAEQSAYKIVKKDVSERHPLEQNLLLSIVFKAVSMIDPRISRSFPVLSKLINKLRAATYWKSDFILRPHEKLRDIRVVYSGNVEQ